jgi:hypothetical protein
MPAVPDVYIKDSVGGSSSSVSPRVVLVLIVRGAVGDGPSDHDDDELEEPEVVEDVQSS